ncbi:hypothetical protein D3C72_2160380 [compost metagenome]
MNAIRKIVDIHGSHPPLLRDRGHITGCNQHAGALANQAERGGQRAYLDTAGQIAPLSGNQLIQRAAHAVEAPKADVITFSQVRQG